jgi:hypothetical protein
MFGDARKESGAVVAECPKLEMQMDIEGWRALDVFDRDFIQILLIVRLLPLRTILLVVPPR